MGQSAKGAPREVVMVKYYFIRTLKRMIKKMPRGTQARIAEHIGIDRQYLSDVLNGRKMLSEEKREKIAEFLGYSYLDLLLLGRKFNDDYCLECYGKVDFDTFIEAVVITYKSFDNLLNKDGFQIGMTISKKADIIIQLYDSMVKYFRLKLDNYLYDENTINRACLIDSIDTYEVKNDKVYDIITLSYDEIDWLKRFDIMLEEMTDIEKASVIVGIYQDYIYSDEYKCNTINEKIIYLDKYISDTPKQKKYA